MLTLPRAVYDALVAHAREGAPEEVCGVLGGTRSGDDARVAVARRATNVADRPRTRYAMDPAEQLRIFEELEADGHDVVGFYHSHPAGPPAPSETDAREATWPGHSYVVVALDGEPFVGSWLWRGRGGDDTGDDDTTGFEQELVGLE